MKQRLPPALRIRDFALLWASLLSNGKVLVAGGPAAGDGDAVLQADLLALHHRGVGTASRHRRTRGNIAQHLRDDRTSMHHQLPSMHQAVRLDLPVFETPRLYDVVQEA